MTQINKLGGPKNGI